MTSDDYAIDISTQSAGNDPHASENDSQNFLISRIVAACLLRDLDGYQNHREFIDSVSKDTAEYIKNLNEESLSAFKTKLLKSFEQELHYQVVEQLTNNTWLHAIENVIANWRDDPEEIKEIEENYIYKMIKGMAEKPDQYPEIHRLAQEICSVLDEVKNIENPNDQQLVAMAAELKALSILSIKPFQLKEAMERRISDNNTQPNVFSMLNECLDEFQKINETDNTKEWVRKIKSFLERDMREQAAGNRRLEINIKRLEKRTDELLEENPVSASYTDRVKPISPNPRWP